MEAVSTNFTSFGALGQPRTCEFLLFILFSFDNVSLPVGSSAAPSAPRADNMKNPGDVFVGRFVRNLFVSDRGQGRVLIFPPVATLGGTSGAAAIGEHRAFVFLLGWLIPGKKKQE